MHPFLKLILIQFIMAFAILSSVLLVTPRSNLRKYSVYFCICFITLILLGRFAYDGSFDIIVLLRDDHIAPITGRTFVLWIIVAMLLSGVGILLDKLKIQANRSLCFTWNLPFGLVTDVGSAITLVGIFPESIVNRWWTQFTEQHTDASVDGVAWRNYAETKLSEMKRRVVSE